MRNKRFYCIIIDRSTAKELAEYEVDALDWYYARHKAAQKYRDENRNKPGYDSDGWYVDSLELEEE